MESMGDDGLSGRWEAWARKALGGDQAQIEAATRAVMSAIGAGASQEEAVARARAAWGGEEAPLPSPAASPVPRPALTPQRTAVSGSEIVGRVAGFQARNEMYGRTYLAVWDFRVEQSNAPPVAVEMRGYAFDGAVANGDEVRIAPTEARGGIVHVHSLENLTSNATVRVTRRAISPGSRVGKTVTTVFVVFFLIVLIFFVVTAVTVFKGHGGP